MLCEHLAPILADLVRQGAKATFAGQAWSHNCRMWVYLDCKIDADALRVRFNAPPCVTVHIHRGTHDGSEHGLVCNEHHDAIMGIHHDYAAGARMLR